MPSETKVNKKTVDWLLDTAHVEEAILHGKTLVVDYALTYRAGFTVTGRAAVVDPTNFDIEIGRRVARENAEHQVWQLEGYLKQLTLAGLVTWVGGE